MKEARERENEARKLAREDFLPIAFVCLTTASSESESLAKSSDATDPTVSALSPLSKRPGENFEMKLISRLRGVFISLETSLSLLPLEGVLDLKNAAGGMGSDGDGVSDAVVATDHRL